MMPRFETVVGTITFINTDGKIIFVYLFITSIFGTLQMFTSQLYPEIADPRKVDTNFLEANFEYFRLLTAMENVDN